MLVQLSEEKVREIERGNEKLRFLKLKGLIDGGVVERANKLQPRDRLAFIESVENNSVFKASGVVEFDESVFRVVRGFYWRPGGRTGVPRQFVVLK